MRLKAVISPSRVTYSNGQRLAVAGSYSAFAYRSMLVPSIKLVATDMCWQTAKSLLYLRKSVPTLPQKLNMSQMHANKLNVLCIQKFSKKLRLPEHIFEY